MDSLYTSRNARRSGTARLRSIRVFQQVAMADSSSSQAFPEATASHLRPFSVDSSLIPSVDSLDELRELGVSVYAQEAFEKGVIEQVDKALAEQEALLRKKRLRRDVKEVLDQIRFSCTVCSRQLQSVRLSRFACQ